MQYVKEINPLLNRDNCELAIEDYIDEILNIKMKNERTNEVGGLTTKIIVDEDSKNYCSMDSVDMYSSKKNFLLNDKGIPTYISGVPGDYARAGGNACREGRIRALGRRG